MLPCQSHSQPAAASWQMPCWHTCFTCQPRHAASVAHASHMPHTQPKQMTEERQIDNIKDVSPGFIIEGLEFLSLRESTAAAACLPALKPFSALHYLFRQSLFFFSTARQECLLCCCCCCTVCYYQLLPSLPCFHAHFHFF